MSGKHWKILKILGGGNQNDILEAVFQPTRGLYQPVDYSEQFDLQWELALDTLRSMRFNGYFNTPLEHTPKPLPTGYKGIPFIVG